MSDAIKTAAERIKTDALNLAERARSEAASAFASVISENAKSLTNEMGPLREKAEELAHDATERLTVVTRELSEKLSENSRYAAQQAKAHPALTLGLAAGGIALIAAAIVLSRRGQQPQASADDENSDYVDQTVVPSPTDAAEASHNVY